MSSDSTNAESPRESEMPDELHRALVAAVVTQDLTGTVLRDAVCGFVRTLKARELPPEAVVVAVKRAVQRATLGLTPTYLERRESGVLLGRAVTWCIEEYYRRDGDGDDGDGARPVS